MILALLTAGSGWLLWFMVKRPQRWAAFVDAENEFWVARGLAPVAWTERVKALEKGRFLKVLVGFCVVVGTGTLLASVVLKVFPK